MISRMLLKGENENRAGTDARAFIGTRGSVVIKINCEIVVVAAVIPSLFRPGSLQIKFTADDDDDARTLGLGTPLFVSHA